MHCRLLQERRTLLQIDKVLQAQSSDLGSCLVQHARREINPDDVLHLQGEAQQQLGPAGLLTRQGRKFLLHCAAMPACHSTAACDACLDLA